MITFISLESFLSMAWGSHKLCIQIPTKQTCGFQGQRRNMGQCISSFSCPYGKTPNLDNLKEEIFILAHHFGGLQSIMARTAKLSISIYDGEACRGDLFMWLKQEMKNKGKKQI